MVKSDSMGRPEEISSADVLGVLDDLDLPFLVSTIVADRLGCSSRHARRKLSTLVDEGELVRENITDRQAVFFRADYDAAEQVADTLRDHFDLTEFDVEHLAAFAEEPYKLLPKSENEYYVVTPRFVPFSVGHLRDADEAWKTFVINKYVNWLGDLPDEFRDRIDFEQKYETATVADGVLEVDVSDLREAWDEFGNERSQKAIPPEDVLTDTDQWGYDKLRRLASRNGLDVGSSPSYEDLYDALNEAREDGKIPLKKSREFDVIAKLIEDGNLPFAPNGIPDEALRPDPANVTLRDYQERAWDTFVDSGQVGVFWPPGMGKTFFGMYAGDRLPGKKLVVVPSSTLENQWEERIENTVEHPDEWEVRTYQYLTTNDNAQDYQGDDAPRLTIYDEAHTLPANTFSKLATIETDTRIGLSATPYREDDRSVAADTDVLIRRDGEFRRQEIEEVYDEGSDGLEVLSYTDGRADWHPVSSITRHETDAFVYRVEVASGRSVSVTAEHSVMTLNEDFIIEPTRADRLSEGDLCLVPNTIQGRRGQATTEQHMLARVLGWYIADGSMSKNKSGYYVLFSMNGGEPDKIERLRDALSHFVDHVGMTEDSGAGIRLTVTRKDFYNFLAEYVEPDWDASSKRVPQVVFDMPTPAIETYLQAYYDGDAGVTINSDLASDTLYLWSLVGELGMRSRSLNEGLAVFDDHVVDQSCLRHVVQPSVGNSPFDRVPRSFIDTALEPVLTAKRTGSPSGRIESVGEHSFESLVGEESMERIEAVRMATDGGITTSGLVETTDKKKRTAEAYLRLLRDRDLIEKVRQGGRWNGDAVWEPTSLGYEMVDNYGRLMNVLRGDYSIVPVREVGREPYDEEYVYDFTVPGPENFVAGEGGVLCHNTDFIFALTGIPVGIEWQELVEYGYLEYPTVSLYLYRTVKQKVADLKTLVDGTGKTLIYCDGIDAGKKLASELDAPFIYGETPKQERLQTLRDNRVVIGSRVADEGVSLDELDQVIEFEFHGSSRRQELQRAGRLMHTDGVGHHIVQMTDDEHEKFSGRLLSLEEKGIQIQAERRA